MKWEYSAHPVHMETWQALGLQGWELVAVVNGTAYFKKPIKK
jgi:hypothetical protein